jgi:aspartate/methionine/tyrosine aminotransferase
MDIIKELGISKTVYSLCYPETENLLKKVWENSNELGLHGMYDNTWTKKQDEYHHTFAESFKTWSKPNLSVQWSDFPVFYPTNGASEAIREQIAYLKTKGDKPIFVFEGEYEGYEAIAYAMQMNVIKIDRNNYQDHKQDFEKGGYFFISQPSSIDGSVWSEYDNFMKFMSNYNVDVYIDTVYIGCISKPFIIDTNYENIKGLFFSLSKAFGVYYHRIGGVFLKETNPLLFGNMWFKNVFSMYFGERLMSNGHPNFFAKNYAAQKQNAIEIIENKLKVKVDDADALLIVNINKTDDDFVKSLIRNQKADKVRICITPTLEKIIRGYNEE